MNTESNKMYTKLHCIPFKSHNFRKEGAWSRWPPWLRHRSMVMGMRTLMLFISFSVEIRKAVAALDQAELNFTFAAFYMRISIRAEPAPFLLVCKHWKVS